MLTQHVGGDDGAAPARPSSQWHTSIPPQPRCVVATAPLRASLVGGGTDFADFYRTGYGATVSLALRRFAVITLARTARAGITMLAEQECWAPSVEQLPAGPVREALRMFGIGPPLHVSICLDVPPGTGLASSSAIAVALVAGLRVLLGETPDPASIAADACHLEIERLHAPIGRQDQYISCVGGARYLKYLPGDTVEIGQELLRAEDVEQCERHMMFFFTGDIRRTDEIAVMQQQRITHNHAKLHAMRELADEMRRLFGGGRIDWREIGRMVNENWRLKRELHPRMSSPRVDAWLEVAAAQGAYGGKLLGAGHGGCVLVIAPPEYHERIRDALGRPPGFPTRLDRAGVRVHSVVD